MSHTTYLDLLLGRRILLLAFQLQPNGGKPNSSPSTATTAAVTPSATITVNTAASTSCSSRSNSCSLTNTFVDAQADALDSSRSFMSKFFAPAIKMGGIRKVHQRLVNRFQFRQTSNQSPPSSHNSAICSNRQTTTCPDMFLFAHESSLPPQSNPIFNAHPANIGLDPFFFHPSNCHTLPVRHHHQLVAGPAGIADQHSESEVPIGLIRLQRLQQQRNVMQERYLQLLRLDAQNLSIKSDSRLAVGRKQRLRQQLIHSQLATKLAARQSTMNKAKGQKYAMTMTVGTTSVSQSNRKEYAHSSLGGSLTISPSDSPPESTCIEEHLSPTSPFEPAQLVVRGSGGADGDDQIQSILPIANRLMDGNLTRAEPRTVDQDSDQGTECNAENTYYYCDANFASLPRLQQLQHLEALQRNLDRKERINCEQRQLNLQQNESTPRDHQQHPDKTIDGDNLDSMDVARQLDEDEAVNYLVKGNEIFQK